MSFRMMGQTAGVLLALLTGLAGCRGDAGLGDAGLGSECSGPLKEAARPPVPYDFSSTSEGRAAIGSLRSHYLSRYNLHLPASTVERLLEREPELDRILYSIRSLERSRVAGWSVDLDERADQMGWVWLTGDEPPCSKSERIADSHPDVEIRTGAAYTHQELLDAAEPLATQAEIAQQAGIACTGREPTVDMHANRLNIVVYLPRRPREPEQGSLNWPEDCEQESLRRSGQTAAEIEREIEDSLRAHISVPFTVTLGDVVHDPG